MDVLRPRTLAEALVLRAEHPAALAIRGGTDVMVELNFDRARPDAILDLGEVAELGGWSRDDGALRLGRRPDVCRDRARRARLGAAGARGGVADGRLAPDSQPGHARRQPRHCISRR